MLANGKIKVVHLTIFRDPMNYEKFKKKIWSPNNESII